MNAREQCAGTRCHTPLQTVLFLILTIVISHTASAKETTFKSKHFDLNCPFPAGRAAIFAKKIEKSYDLIRQMVGTSKTSVRPTILILPDQQSFLQQAAQDKIASTSFVGYFSPRTERVVTYTQAEDAQTTQILAHELAHFMLRKRLPNPPLWLNEGIAEYLSGATYSFGKPLAGRLSSGKSKAILAAQKNGTLLPLDQLLGMKEYPFRTGLFYTQSQALVWYLWEGERGKFQNKLKTYLQALENKKNDADQFRAIFGNLQKFQKDWIKEIEKRAKSRSKGTRSVPTL